MNLDHFAMDTITLAGPLEAKLRAVRAAGFIQIMLNASDIVGHPSGEPAAVEAVRASGVRLSGFQVLRDFERLSGHLHAYKVDVAKAMFEMCGALGSRVLLICSSTSGQASGETDALVKDLRIIPWIFHRDGVPIRYFRRAWLTAATRAGVPGRLPHDFRRTALTGAVITAHRGGLTARPDF